MQNESIPSRVAQFETNSKVNHAEAEFWFKMTQNEFTALMTFRHLIWH